MPTTPWQAGPAAGTTPARGDDRPATGTDPSSGGNVVVFASRLPLRGRWTPPRFLWAIVRVMGQLRGAPGLLGHSLRAELLTGTYWTVSAWTSTEAMNAFVGTEPHRGVMRSMAAALGTPTFVTWEVPAAELPVAWDDVEARIAASV